MNDTPTLIEGLRSSTRSRHEAVEQVMQSDKIMDGSLTPEDYERLLRVNHTIFLALQDAVLPNPTMFSLFIDRVNDLATDMNALGLDYSCKAEPIFESWSYYQKVGALYVLNGSALGGNMIASHLKKYEWIESSRFYRHDRHIMEQWKAFKSFLAALSITGDQGEQVIIGAQATFDAFIRLAGEMELA